MDARNSLYEGRIALASTMIELDELEQRGSALVAACESSNTTSASDRTRSYVEDCNAKQQKAVNRTTEIISTAEKLQQDIDQARKEIEQRKAAIARRKADLASASQGIAARRNREFEETKTSIRKLKYHWDREHEATAQYRAALCAEVAKLYRLQRIKKGNPNRYEYKIGGLEVVDLHLLNSELVSVHQCVSSLLMIPRYAS
jgi:predicted RNase H-like nuclease (RuvC/YqgF family)